MIQQGFHRNAIFWVELDKIQPNPFQPRKEFDENALQSLADSIKQYGVLQPLVVTRKEEQTPDGGLKVHYELVAGERRLRASKLAGLTQVPVLIRDKEDTDQEKLELAIIENLQREDLNPIDKALAFKQLVDKFGMTHVQIAKKVGKSREYVSNALRLLALPEDIQRAIANGIISEGHARPLLMLSDKPEEQQTLFKEITMQKLTVRESEHIARSVATEKVRKHNVSPEIVKLERELTESLGTRVRIEHKDGDVGRIHIDFTSKDDLLHLANLVKKHKEHELAPRPPKLESADTSEEDNAQTSSNKDQDEPLNNLTAAIGGIAAETANDSALVQDDTDKDILESDTQVALEDSGQQAQAMTNDIQTPANSSPQPTQETYSTSSDEQYSQDITGQDTQTNIPTDSNSQENKLEETAFAPEESLRDGAYKEFPTPANYTAETPQTPQAQPNRDNELENTTAQDDILQGEPVLQEQVSNPKDIDTPADNSSNDDLSSFEKKIDALLKSNEQEAKHAQKPQYPSGTHTEEPISPDLQNIEEKLQADVGSIMNDPASETPSISDVQIGEQNLAVNSDNSISGDEAISSQINNLMHHTDSNPEDTSDLGVTFNAYSEEQDTMPGFDGKPLTAAEKAALKNASNPENAGFDADAKNLEELTKDEPDDDLYSVKNFT